MTIRGHMGVGGEAAAEKQPRLGGKRILGAVTTITGAVILGVGATLLPWTTLTSIIFEGIKGSGGDSVLSSTAMEYGGIEGYGPLVGALLLGGLGLLMLFANPKRTKLGAATAVLAVLIAVGVRFTASRLSLNTTIEIIGVRFQDSLGIGVWVAIGGCILGALGGVLWEPRWPWERVKQGSS